MSMLTVASFTDAWIETVWTDAYVHTRQSHLLQMRGLKLRNATRGRKPIRVASFTDAWIETTCESPFRTASKSHLLQMRGLKHA